jgi:hypothetical protein
MAKDLGALVLSSYERDEDPDDAVSLLEDLLKRRQMSSADIHQLMSLAYELGKEESHKTLAELDGTEDAADWLVAGHTLDEQEVEFLRNR